MVQTYHSKVDTWLILSIYGTLAISFAPFLTGFFPLEWPCAILIVAIAAFVSNVLFGMKYTISEGTLQIKCGIIPSGKYDIAKLHKVTATHTLLSSPAASIDRIQLKFHGNESVVVSPRKKADFIKQLEQINPNITVNV